MAVEAGHINLVPSQLLTTDCRGFIKHNQVNMETYNTQMDFALPLAMAMPESFFPYQQTSVCVPASAKVSMNKSDSGLSSYHQVSVPRKRPRDFINELNVIPDSVPLKKSCVVEKYVSQIQQQQQSEIDRFISEQTEKVKLELEEKRLRQSRTLAAAIQQAAMKKMTEMDEEIQRIVKLNWVLQEKVRSLCVENQIWRELAQTNEATANSLRNNLQQVLAHASEDHDAESSCGSNDVGWGKIAAEEGDTGASVAMEMAAVAVVGGHEGNWGGSHGLGEMKKMCKRCGERESSVLLLPCRHLCLCRICGSTLLSCPVCHSVINASLHVNFS